MFTASGIAEIVQTIGEALRSMNDAFWRILIAACI